MKTMKTVAVVVVALSLARLGLAQAPPAAGAEAAVTAPSTLSPGAAEVVRLATSGVGDDVVLAYIQNSQAAFNLSANDVLYLKDVGLSSQVTSAMINHDSSLRTQPQPQYAPAATTPAPAPTAAAAPATQPVATATVPTVASAPAPVYVTSPPADVTYFYSDLSPYGTWVQLDGVGWCWQPTTVVLSPGWRPYCDGGYWVYSDLGWYWQSTYSWGWAPFHYGRWHQHPRCGWVWMPDRTWGPAWVTWRSYGDTCGWAPLPPHSTFDVRLGWCYNGVSVGASFGWNLGSDAFLFVGFGNVCSRNVRPHCLPPPQAANIYRQTTIINNYTVVNNHVVHRGIPVDRVSTASRAPVPRATVRDWSSRPGQMPARAGGSVVYRPHLEAPAKPVRMEAQKVDNQHPSIRHSVAAAPAVGRAGAPGHSGSTPASSTRQFGSRPGGSPGSQAAPAAPQTRSTSPAGRSPQSSYGSQGSRTKAPPQSTPAAAAPQSPSGATRSQIAPRTEASPTASQPTAASPTATRWSKPQEDWKQGTRTAPSYRSEGTPSALNSSRSTETTAQNPHVYYPKGYYQNSELRSSRPTGTTGSSSTPSRGNSSGAPGHNR